MSFSAVMVFHLEGRHRRLKLSPLENNCTGISRELCSEACPPHRKTVGWCVSFHSRNVCGHRALPPSESKCQEGRQNRSRTL